MADAHTFDRRGSDANVQALAVRVSGLEGRMETVERAVRTNSLELQANTRLTKQVHEMAERTEGNTMEIVNAVKWLSTTKKLVVVLVAGVGGIATAGSAVVGFGRLAGWW
jgi:hypothetical protein